MHCGSAITSPTASEQQAALLDDERAGPYDVGLLVQAGCPSFHPWWVMPFVSSGELSLLFGAALGVQAQL